MALAILNSAESGPSSVNVVRVFWDAAETLNPLTAAAQTLNTGQQLATALRDILPHEATAGLQFIGHSLGSHVNAHAANILAGQGITTTQFTILDRPFGDVSSAQIDIDGLVFRSLLSEDRTIWVDNYFGNNMGPLVRSRGAAFDNDIAAFNHLYDGATHAGVHERYFSTISPGAVCSTTEGGFGCSITSGNFEDRPASRFWDPDIANGSASAGLVSQVLAFTDSLWDTVNCSLLGLAGLSVNCEERSPAYLWSDTHAFTANDQFLSFDFEWLNKGDGDWLTLHFDDTLLFSYSGQTFDQNGSQNSGLIPVAQLQGETGQLLFTLNSVGASNAQLNLSNLQVSQIAETAVPEPGTWAMFLFGFCIIGSALRKRITITDREALLNAIEAHYRSRGPAERD